MIDINQFTRYVIRPALKAIGKYSQQAEEIVLGTALQESELTFLVQLGNGPARGLFQMEPPTHNDIWDNFLEYNNELAIKVAALSVTAEYSTDEHDKLYVIPPQASELVWNLQYAAAMARMQYLRVKDPLPPAGDVPAQAVYWKEYYNTYLGDGTVEEYEESWFTNHPDPENILDGSGDDGEKEMQPLPPGTVTGEDGNVREV